MKRQKTSSFKFYFKIMTIIFFYYRSFLYSYLLKQDSFAASIFQLRPFSFLPMTGDFHLWKIGENNFLDCAHVVSSPSKEDERKNE